MFNIGERLQEMFLEWITSAIEMVVEFLQNILLNYDGLAGLALDAYNLFVYVGGLLVVTLALAKVIQQLLSEAEGSQEADIWYTIINSFKAGGLIVIMPFIISVTMNGIVQPISSYFIEEMGILTVDNIEGVMNAETMPDIFSEGLNQVILMLFLLIVIGFYAFKLFVSQAQILILEILSPLVAVSVVSDDYDFMDNWWRDLLSHTVTIMVLTLCMALFTEALTMDTETIWGKLPLLIGSGALVLSGPSLLKSIWFSSGAGRAGGGVARTLMYRVMR
ncbi:MAG TPA: conjugal transfer protein TrbL family protein [Pseudogracilibacillus sp.]|nr:conjugal transfer protein TrbL family protein [Pseudogracilibacillus sp.]